MKVTLDIKFSDEDKVEFNSYDVLDKIAEALQDKVVKALQDKTLNDGIAPENMLTKSITISVEDGSALIYDCFKGTISTL